MLLPLNPCQRDTLYEQPLAEKEDKQHRQKDDQRNSHHIVKVHLTVLASEHIQTYGQHLLLQGADIDEWHQEIVPIADESENHNSS